MKCPKCGYNSFEFLDQCKKCSADLTMAKKRCGIKAVLQPSLPPSTPAPPPENIVAEPTLAPAGELLLESTPSKPADMFDLGVFSATPSFARAVPAAEPEEIVLEGMPLPPPAVWAQPEVLGRREEFDEGEETSALLLEEMVSLEEVTAGEEDPPLLFDADNFEPVIETPPEEERPASADAT